MRLVILTSDNLRHRYFINRLSERFDVCGVVMEKKKRDYTKKGEGTELYPQVKKYFNARERSEKLFFEDYKKVTGNVLKIEAGDLNEEFVIDQIKEWRPDYIAVFGSSLLQKEIIDLVPKNHILNMHLGLSPYYRGSGTNFWPLYNGEPEYVGVTIHYLTEGIDSGDIIVQGRPSIWATDTPHTIGNKAIQVGVKLMTRSLMASKKVVGKKQNKKKGRLYLFKHCTPKHIIELDRRWKKILRRYFLTDIKNVKIKENLYE